MVSPSVPTAGSVTPSRWVPRWGMDAIAAMLASVAAAAMARPTAWRCMRATAWAAACSWMRWSATSCWTTPCVAT
ncbi:hypothetical protein G6F32_017553 [Rhizopus arrhizus]|uniref:Uncharacterized protein n=1 Tax=Rhizopus delemar TaxID=936053 RepID=A0A9P6XT36_9FUNG|nr:hypothetical protein G6F24_018777 [Rhizopus arrhizus]KAG0890839.1 hypothetical protein G6F32_017553 [Rhizopus arrhizus]KAG1531779.1 hypothetical protein G6F50_016516 [Rhizopus delemar]